MRNNAIGLISRLLMILFHLLLMKSARCPPELAIYIHGVWVGSNSLEKPAEIFNRAKKSIAANNFVIPLVGFSWDSDTKILPADGT